MLATLQVIILNLVSLKNSESQSCHKNLNRFNSALGLMAKCQIGGACRNFLINTHIFLAARDCHIEGSPSNLITPTYQSLHYVTNQIELKRSDLTVRYTHCDYSSFVHNGRSHRNLNIVTLK